MYDIELDNIAIEGMLYDIALEADKQNKNPGRLRMMLANLCKSISVRCNNNLSKAKSNNQPKLISLWQSLYNWFSNAYKKLSKIQNLTDAQLESTKREVEQKVSQVKATEKKNATEKSKPQEKQELREQPNTQQEGPKDFTYTDGDRENGRPQKSRNRAKVVRYYANLARECKEKGDINGYKKNIKLRDEAAQNPNLNSIFDYDPNLEYALEEYLGYDLYHFTVINGSDFIASEGFNDEESYIDDMIEFGVAAESSVEDRVMSILFGTGV